LGKTHNPREKEKKKKTNTTSVASALTLEHLEAEFYRQALANLADDASVAAAFGITEQQAADMRAIGATESAHVSLLQGALAQAGVKPVEACTYDFSAALSSPATIVSTAIVVENIGVSAYLGAAPLLLSNPPLLATAASILTVEARHQSSLRVFTGAPAVPAPFDAALGVRSVFSLAAPFIVECPQGSNLVLEAFPAVALADDAGVDANALQVGSSLKLVVVEGSSGAAGAAAGAATHCAFTAGGASLAGTVFAPFTEADGCAIPHTVTGVAYVSLVSSAPLEAVVTDDIIVAGPMAVVVN
jgi:hypothetical protein